MDSTNCIFTKTFENSFEGYFEFWQVVKVHLDEEIKFVIEGHGQYVRRLALFLAGQNQIVFEANPEKVKKFREALMENKSDLLDSQVLALFYLAAPQSFKEIHLTEEWSGLKELVRFRFELTKSLNGDLNRLHQQLTVTFGPIYEEFFGKLAQKTSLLFFFSLSTSSNAYKGIQ